MKDKQQAPMPPNRLFLTTIDIVKFFLDSFWTSGGAIGANSDGRVPIVTDVRLAA
jgi:hypothetical protein